jgi:hypothetical protein
MRRSCWCSWTDCVLRDLFESALEPGGFGCCLYAGRCSCCEEARKQSRNQRGWDESAVSTTPGVRCRYRLSSAGLCVPEPLLKGHIAILGISLKTRPRLGVKISCTPCADQPEMPMHIFTDLAAIQMLLMNILEPLLRITTVRLGLWVPPRPWRRRKACSQSTSLLHGRLERLARRIQTEIPFQEPISHCLRPRSLETPLQPRPIGEAGVSRAAGALCAVRW